MSKMDESLLSKLQGLSFNSTQDQFSLTDVEDLWKEYFSDVEISIEILRALRKLAASLTSSQKQELLLHHRSLFDLCTKVLEKFPKDSSNILLTRVALQFIFNSFQGCEEMSSLKCLGGTLSNILATCSDSKVQDYSCSLIFLGNDLFTDFKELYPLLLTACLQHESHFALLAIQRLMKTSFFQFFKSLENPKYKSALIQILLSNEESLIHSGPEVSRLFKERSKIIMSANCTWTPDEASEVTSLLDVLLEVSSRGKHLQDDRNLLIDAIHLLKMVHGAQSEGSPFCPIRKLSDVSSEDQRKSAYGFKRDLIRLIGNLVYEHEENQNLVRDLDGLSLILDCSPIDGKNPFITQWVVFAVRNLTQCNQKSQEIIAQMEKSGKLDRKLLVEAGIILSK